MATSGEVRRVKVGEDRVEGVIVDDMKGPWLRIGERAENNAEEGIQIEVSRRQPQGQCACCCISIGPGTRRKSTKAHWGLTGPRIWVDGLALAGRGPS